MDWLGQFIKDNFFFIIISVISMVNALSLYRYPKIQKKELESEKTTNHVYADRPITDTRHFSDARTEYYDAQKTLFNYYTSLTNRKSTYILSVVAAFFVYIQTAHQWAVNHITLFMAGFSLFTTIGIWQLIGMFWYSHLENYCMLPYNFTIIEQQAQDNLSTLGQLRAAIVIRAREHSNFDYFLYRVVHLHGTQKENCLTIVFYLSVFLAVWSVLVMVMPTSSTFAI